MSARSRARGSLAAVLGLGLVLCSTSCAGEKLKGTVNGVQTRLQRAIENGSKTIGCAPKETALAEANIRFALDALAMGEFYRGKEHADLSDTYTQLATAKTDPVKCRPPDSVREIKVAPGDKDGDGFLDDVDACPEDPEDFDAFEDDDGCPDPDNDKDTVLDAVTFAEGKWTNNDQKEGVDCRNNPEDKDEFEDEDGCPDPDNDKDGILDASDQCPNDPEDFDSFEDEDGCPDPDNDKDGLLDGVDQCPNEPEDFDGDADEDGCPDLKVKLDKCAIKLDDKVFFEFNKHNVDPRSFRLLDDVVTVMQGSPDITIEIGGHTDSKGSDSYNKKLSQRRVDSVLDYLAKKGVTRSRLTAVGYGEGVPLASNKTADGRAQNRRVEFNRTDNPECRR